MDIPRHENDHLRINQERAERYSGSHREKYLADRIGFTRAKHRELQLKMAALGEAYKELPEGSVYFRNRTFCMGRNFEAVERSLRKMEEADITDQNQFDEFPLSLLAFMFSELEGLRLTLRQNTGEGNE